MVTWERAGRVIDSFDLPKRRIASITTGNMAPTKLIPKNGLGIGAKT